MSSTCLKILKRTGAVLVAVGLLDIALMLYGRANNIEYSSNFNIFAVVAGFFLLRGDLRAASLIRWLAVFIGVLMVALLLAWPLVEPLDLTWTQARLHPRWALQVSGMLAFALVLLLWLYLQLNRAAIREARMAAGMKVRDMRLPAVAALVLAVLLVALMKVLTSGETADRALAMASQQLGSGYRYHVAAVGVRMEDEATYTSVTVTAWNAKEIQQLRIEW